MNILDINKILPISDNRIPKETFTNVKSSRTARNMKETVLHGLQTINELYSNLILDEEEKQSVNLRIIGTTDEKRSDGDDKKVVHYHDRYTADAK